MIKVLVVEDSPTAREMLVHLLSSDAAIQVIGTASNGEEALEFLKRKKPDVITMDINMPKMNGLEATRRIMETAPTPIVIVQATWDAKETALTFRGVEAGALAVLQRPRGIGHPDHETSAKELVQTVKLMSEVKVVRRWTRAERGHKTPAARPPAGSEAKPIEVQIKLVVMGASTGGPVTLQTILSGLPKDFALPVLIVQHMAPGFIQGFAEWLAQVSDFPVHVATDGEYLLSGHAYVAPDGFQMSVDLNGRIVLSKDEPEHGHRPSVSYLLRSVVDGFGPNAIGVLLTGMGNDGAEELKRMKDEGAVTLVQDKKSSVVYGMPGEALKLDAATYVLSPDRIAVVLGQLANKKQVYRDLE